MVFNLSVVLKRLNHENQNQHFIPLRHGLTSPTCPEKESKQLLTPFWVSWNLTTKQPLGLYRSIITTSWLNILNMWISTSDISWLFINGRTSIHAHLNIFEGKIKFKDDKIALTLSSRICQLDHHSSPHHLILLCYKMIMFWGSCSSYHNIWRELKIKSWSEHLKGGLTCV